MKADIKTKVFSSLKANIQDNFKFSTLSFIFIISYVTVFPVIFGQENSIVAVIFTIMMSASMVRDLTAAPLKHLVIQSGVLVFMAAAACFVSNADPLIALPVNLIAVFIILYSFTYEYMSHMYFPYILSYLFLLFISPIEPSQLPKRLAAMLAGALSIILYQLFMGRKRAADTAHDVLTSMIEEADKCIKCLTDGNGIGIPKNPEQIRADLCKLSRIVYERRKRVLCISNAAFAMIDSGRGLENLVILLYSLEGPITEERKQLLMKVSETLSAFKEFVQDSADVLEPLDRSDFVIEASQESECFFDCLEYIREHLIKMTNDKERYRYGRTLMSFAVRLKAAVNFSQVRAFYAARVSVTIALCTAIVQMLGLPHGKWLLFTVASVSLPYTDEVPAKALKRLAATVIGGVVGAVLFSLIPSQAGRTAIMMLSGYLSFYFHNYCGTFACSTVGALGGAVFAESFGWSNVFSMFIVRLGYICVGIAVALLVNCLICPFKKKKASEQLWDRYVKNVDILTDICRNENVDTQLYYSLVITSHLQEDKLYKNAMDAGAENMKDILEKCRVSVRSAHRKRAEAVKV